MSIELTITSMAHGPSGVGRFQTPEGELVVFVPGAAPGDVVRCEITAIKKNYAEAKLLEVLKPGPTRAQPPCPYYGTCGGCQWQHLDYPAQLDQKQLIVEHALRRIAREESVGADFEIRRIIPSPNIWHYRNRVQVRTKDSVVGFYKRGSHELVDVAQCLICEDGLNAELIKLRQERAAGGTRSASIGRPETKIELLVDENGGIHRSLNRAHGEELGFSQVNTAQNAQMQKFLQKLVGPPQASDQLLDLYCGQGNFSFPLAALGWMVHGVDNNRRAVRSAQIRATQWASTMAGTPPARACFVYGDGVSETKKLAAAGRRFDVVLLDPPRIGADDALWKPLAALRPQRMLYVSCSPATFARDWARIKKTARGARLVMIQPFDMFPQTFHVELIALIAMSNS